ncbi:MAG: porin family protein [SAR324 cluster bacterium]|nr:porin family protein [SAR324 cluster bacterium]
MKYLFCLILSSVFVFSAHAEDFEETMEEVPRSFATYNWSVGAGLGVYSLPEDKDFSASGYPLDFFLDHNGDWMDWRLGYNMTQADLTYEAHGKTWKHKAQTDSLYLDYRSTSINGSLEIYGLAGLAYMNSALKTNNNIANQTDAGFGLTLGAGLFYMMKTWGLGGQFHVFSRNSNFNNVSVATGSNQFLLMVKYMFPGEPLP